MRQKDQFKTLVFSRAQRRRDSEYLLGATQDRQLSKEYGRRSRSQRILRLLVEY